MRVDKFLNTVPLKSKLQIGDFKVEFVSVTHSIPEPNGLLIETPLGKVYHTGDWKFDDAPIVGDVTDFSRMREIADAGVDAVICDSTNAPDAGVSGSEATILEPLKQAVAAAKGRVAITTFASNVARMKTVMQAFAESGRQYVLCGRSVERIYRISREMNYFGDVPEPITFEEARDMPRDKVGYICTGSQGESRSALFRIAQGAHPFLNLTGGDTVIFSSKTIPGNEKEVGKLYNALCARGVSVVTSKEIPIHVSGHPCAEELSDLYRFMQPKSAIPVHGEERHMRAHARLASECGVPATLVPHNGDVISLAPGRPEIIGQTPHGRLYVDGSVIDDEDYGACSERRKLTYAGYCNIFLAIDRAGKLAAEPIVATAGIPNLGGLSGGDLNGFILRTVINAYRDLREEDFESDEAVKDDIRTAVRRSVNAVWRKKPVTNVFIARTGSPVKMRHVAGAAPVPKTVRMEKDDLSEGRGKSRVKRRGAAPAKKKEGKPPAGGKGEEAPKRGGGGRRRGGKRPSRQS